MSLIIQVINRLLYQRLPWLPVVHYFEYLLILTSSNTFLGNSVEHNYMSSCVIYVTSDTLVYLLMEPLRCNAAVEVHCII